MFYRDRFLAIALAVERERLEDRLSPNGNRGLKRSLGSAHLLFSVGGTR